MDGLEGLLAASFALIAIIFIILIAYLVFYLIGMVKLFKKTGKDGWIAIIPFYNVFVLTEVSGLEWWWFLLACAPTLITYFSDSSALDSIAGLVQIFAYVNISFNLARKFHKDSGWGILCGIFHGIAFPIMGYSKGLVYDANVPVSKNGFIDKDKVVPPNGAMPGQQPMGGYQQPMGGQPGPMPGPMGPQPGPMPGPMGPQPGPVPGPMGPQPGPVPQPMPEQPAPQSMPEQPQVPGGDASQPIDNNMNNFQ